MASVYERILYSILNYAPFAYISLYGFRSSLRLSRRITWLLFLISVMLETVFLLLGSSLPDPFPVILTQVCTLQRIVLYFVAVKASWGRTVFNLLMVQNVANCTVVIAKSVEGMLFPAYASTPYCWSNSLCLGVLLLLGLPLLLRFLDRYFTQDIRDFSGTNIWSYLWLVPLFFWLLWTDRFYYSGQGSLSLALQPKMSVIMLIYIVGQLTIYACIARMVIFNNQSVLLQEATNQLSRQSLQYQHISARIKEVTTLRHDMRHSLVLMKNYCDHGQYDKLQEYLSQYAAQFSGSSISYCANIPINVLLVYYESICQKNGIDFEVSLRIPEELPLSEVETTVLFGNLLENAVDACISLKQKPGRIRVEGSVKQEQLVFLLSNSYDSPLRQDSFGNFLSTKHEGAGIGTESVRTILQKNNGTLEFRTEDGQFEVRFLLPIKAPEPDISKA